MGFNVGTAAATNARRVARLITALLVIAVLILSGQVAHASDQNCASQSTTAGAASDTEAEYLTAVTSDFETLTDSIDRFNEILIAPSFGDQDSIEVVDEILTSWITVYADAAMLTPPSGYEEIHSAYLAFTGLLTDAAMDLIYGDTESAAEGLDEAVEQAEILTDLLDDASRPEIFDVKSGHVQR